MNTRAALGAALLLSSVLLLQAAQQAEVRHIQEGTSRTPGAAADSSTDTLAAVQQLVHILQGDGAQINVDIHDTQSPAGLILLAHQDIKAGGTILSMPVDHGFIAVAVNGVTDFLLDFVLDLHDPDSPRRLMWAATPPPHKLRHLLNFPQQYLPLLQHNELEEWMGQGMHADLRAYYDMHKEVLTAANVSYDGVVHALGLIGTRTFSRPHPSGQASIYYALPLLDMANHNNSCPHYNTFNACQSDPDRECVYFTAGADIKAGEEVCYWYGHLLPDRAFLEYGFLPEVPGSKPAKSKKRRKSSKVAEAQMPALPLFSIDRHDFDASEPLVKLQEPPKAFSGDLSSISARMEELQVLQDTLKAGDGLAAQVAAQGPADGDEGGVFLQQLQQWRLQRQQAVAGELQRLRGLKTAAQIRGALSAARLS